MPAFKPIFYLHRSWPPVICMQQRGSVHASQGEHASRSTWGGDLSLFTCHLVYTWKWRSTHLCGIMGCHSCEIWRQSKDFREWHVATDSNFIYCIWSEKTSISAKSVVWIFIYIPFTLPDRRKTHKKALPECRVPHPHHTHGFLELLLLLGEKADSQESDYRCICHHEVNSGQYLDALCFRLKLVLRHQLDRKLWNGYIPRSRRLLSG